MVWCPYVMDDVYICVFDTNFIRIFVLLFLLLMAFKLMKIVIVVIIYKYILKVV